jgi:hypothetical protein
MNPPVRCQECGFAAESITQENAAESVRAIGRRYQAPLTRLLPGETDQVLRIRPAPETWSALEYSAHMRDVIALWGSTLHRALVEERPRIPLPDAEIADRYAADRAYNEEDPSQVAHDLLANATRMARKVESAGVNLSKRAVFFGDEKMTALAIVRKVGHEGAHHLLDIGRSLRAARSSA